MWAKLGEWAVKALLIPLIAEFGKYLADKWKNRKKNKDAAKKVKEADSAQAVEDSVADHLDGI